MSNPLTTAASGSTPVVGTADGLGALAKVLETLAGPLEAKNLYYNTKTVTLDGYRWKECRFDNCVLVITGTNFVLDHCVLDATCRIQYGAAVAKVVQLFTSRYSWFTTAVPSLAPVQNADGTISIGA